MLASPSVARSRIARAALSRFVASSRLVDYAWGNDGGDVSLLKTHISHIRTKLGMAVTGQNSISVVPSVGYRLNRSSAPAAVQKCEHCQTADLLAEGRDGEPIPLHAERLEPIAVGVN